MGKNRLEAFSDGVIAIIITIMVLELHVPRAAHDAEWRDLLQVLPDFLAYVLSFFYIAIYWNNHHHMVHTVRHVNASILWANLHLLFWLSLFPFAAAWEGETHGAAVPAAAYGGILFMAGVAYLILQGAIIRAHGGRESPLALAVGCDVKGKISAVFYLAAIPLAYVNPWIANVIYAGVALMWVVPDRRIERVVTNGQQ